MKITQKTFLRVLFDSLEETCFAKTAFETEISRYPKEDDVYFSINPMRGSRADKNVTIFRNILVEIDNLPLDEQFDYVKTKLPVTSIVYSGGKSYHFIISLEEPCKTKEEYDNLVRRVFAAVPMADKSTKNASRFSRLPYVTRPDTGNWQHILFLGQRISKDELEAVLPPPEALKATYVQPEGFYSTLVVDSMFYPDAVMRKIGIESRNQYFFWLGQRLKEANAPYENRLSIVDKTYDALKNKSYFSRQEAYLAARVNK